jgi:hypothetical protein
LVTASSNPAALGTDLNKLLVELGIVDVRVANIQAAVCMDSETKGLVVAGDTVQKAAPLIDDIDYVRLWKNQAIQYGSYAPANLDDGMIK